MWSGDVTCRAAVNITVLTCVGGLLSNSVTVYLHKCARSWNKVTKAADQRGRGEGTAMVPNVKTAQDALSG